MPMHRVVHRCAIATAAWVAAATSPCANGWRCNHSTAANGWLNCHHIVDPANGWERCVRR